MAGHFAQMSTIGYLRPAVISLIAYVFLKESLAWCRWLVILIGFAAVLFIFSPESSHLQIIALLAICGLCCVSAATILQKYLSRDISDLPLMVWYSVGVAFVTAPFAMWVWATPSPTELIMMVMTGLLTTTAQFFFIRAFRRAEASFFAPMFYFHMIPTKFTSFFSLPKIPSIKTVSGALIIFATLITMTLFERRK